MALTRREFLLALPRPLAARPAGEARAADASRERAATIEQAVFSLTNDVRTGRRLPPLDPSDALAAIARAPQPGHADAGLLRPLHARGAALVGPDCAGRPGLRRDRENIYMVKDAPTGPADLASAMVKGWMNSRGHRANILTPDYRVVGVGVVATPRIVSPRSCSAGSGLGRHRPIVARSGRPSGRAAADDLRPSARPKPRAEPCRSRPTPPLPPAPRRRRGLPRA